MFSILSARRATMALALTSAGALIPGAAHAQGFFEQLFGGLQQQAPVAAPPAPSYGYDVDPGVQQAPRPIRPKRKLVDAKPVLQKPTDLMHDKTLQVGDAVMMRDGLHIYEGSEDTSKHSRDEFTPIDDARHLMSKKERNTLLAMDTTRNDPLRGALAPDTLASGRSAAVAVPVTQGYKITDTHGRSIRYVGP